MQSCNTWLAAQPGGASPSATSPRKPACRSQPSPASSTVGAHVAPETHELVQNAAEQLRARTPGSRTGATRAAQSAVYLRCPYVLTDYFGLIVSAIAETLALHGRAVVLDAGTAAQQATVLPSLPSRPGIVGAIVILPPEPSEQLVALRAR